MVKILGTVLSLSSSWDKTVKLGSAAGRRSVSPTHSSPSTHSLSSNLSSKSQVAQIPFHFPDMQSRSRGKGPHQHLGMLGY